MEIYFWAFAVGGLICVIGQILLDVARLTPSHVMSILVVSGAVLGGLGLYQPLIDFAGAGATVPITSFGNSLLEGALVEAERTGLVVYSPGYSSNQRRYLLGHHLWFYSFPAVQIERLRGCS